MSEDKEDRQYDPSEQKLRQAREKGDIPRSPESTVALSYLGTALALAMLGGAALDGWSAMAERLLGAEPWPEAPASAADLAVALGRRSGWTVLAMLAAPALLVLLGLVIQRGIVFTPSKLAPDINRINPMKNAAQKFGRQGLTAFAMSLGKTCLVAAGGWLLFGRFVDRLGSAASLGGGQWTLALPVLTRQVMLLALGIAVAFAAIDIFWKRLDFMRRNRMTRKEVEDEHKESEGDPHLKNARRQRAVDIALGTMLADVEKADVVIVNPTHYAVALEWKRGSGRAPVCLAKGVDEVALRIRERAREHKVPIWSDPPCARALHATVKLGEEIPHDQFGPVAAAIRFAEAMRVRARAGWGAEGSAGQGADGAGPSRPDASGPDTRVPGVAGSSAARSSAARSSATGPVPVGDRPNGPVPGGPGARGGAR